MPWRFHCSSCQSLASLPVAASYAATLVGRSPCGVARRACRTCGKKSNVAECVTICQVRGCGVGEHMRPWDPEREGKTEGGRAQGTGSREGTRGKGGRQRWLCG